MNGDVGYVDVIFTRRTCPFCGKILPLKLTVPSGDKVTEYNLIAEEMDKHYKACPSNQGGQNVYSGDFPNNP